MAKEDTFNLTSSLVKGVENREREAQKNDIKWFLCKRTGARICFFR